MNLLSSWAMLYERLVIRAYPKTVHEAREEMVLGLDEMGLDEMRKHVS